MKKTSGAAQSPVSAGHFFTQSSSSRHFLVLWRRKTVGRLELLSDGEVELSAVYTGQIVDFVESISPVKSE